MLEHRVRHASVLVAVITAFAVIAAGCDTGTQSPPTQGPDTGCDHWCGNGSASVTLGGATTTISGGGCFDTGATGYDIRFGDWQGLQGVSSYLAVNAYRAGGPTPTPIPTADPLAAPSATGHPSPQVSGSISGVPFVLGTDTVVTFKADGTGSFQGTDVDGAGPVKGTYTCG
jgi:hypothetical protein